MLTTIVEALERKFPPNRAVVILVTLLTPPLTIAAYWASTFCATHLPGLPHFTGGQALAFGLAAAAAVLTPVVTWLYQWMKGWAAHENQDHALERALVEAGNVPDRAHALMVGEIPPPLATPLIANDPKEAP